MGRKTKNTIRRNSMKFTKIEDFTYVTTHKEVGINVRTSKQYEGSVYVALSKGNDKKGIVYVTSSDPNDETLENTNQLVTFVPENTIETISTVYSIEIQEA